MLLKFIRRDRGSFSGGLLPFLPVCCRVRAERVLVVRVMRRYGKSKNNEKAPHRGLLSI